MLAPAQFVGLLAEAKGDELEGRAARKNPTARLIWRIKSAISAPIFPFVERKACGQLRQTANGVWTIKKRGANSVDN